jgi:hypothetical protein
MCYSLNELVPPVTCNPVQLLSLLLNLYDLRSGGIETSNRNSKSGLGLNKRNKRSFAAQEMLLLLAQLAYLVLSWFHHLFLQLAPRFVGYGWQRLVRDLFHIPGKLTLDEQNCLIAITLSREHGLSKDLIDTFRASKSFNDLSLILRKI